MDKQTFCNRQQPVNRKADSMLSETRFGRHFKIVGDHSTHYGLFDSGPSAPLETNNSSDGACC